MSSPYRTPMDLPSPPDAEARAQIERELVRDERLLWFGRPVQGVQFARTDVYRVPFGLMWAAIALSWALRALRSGAPLFLAFWGFPFVALGIYAVAGRFFVDRSRRARTFYGVTSRRALIVITGRPRSVASFDLAAQYAFLLREGDAGRGTIVLGDVAQGHHGGANAAWAAGGWPAEASWSPRFEEIEAPRAVHEKLLEVQRSLRELPGARARVAPLVAPSLAAPAECEAIEPDAAYGEALEEARRG